MHSDFDSLCEVIEERMAPATQLTGAIAAMAQQQQQHVQQQQRQQHGKKGR